MYNLKSETRKAIARTIESKLGITYEEFAKLDFDEQQKLISKYRQKRKDTKKVTVMIGSGEHSIFTRVEKGKRVMIGSGKHSCFVRAGITPEEERQEFDDRSDEAVYSKPVALVKKLKRRIKNRNF